MADTPSALPRAAQVQLQAMQDAQPPVTTPAAPAATTPAVPAATTPAATTPAANGETVTVSREEFNTLQARAGKTAQAESQIEVERQRGLDLAHRLTELEKAGKASPEAKPSAPAPLVEAVEITQDERKEFEESEPFITKVARNEVAKGFAVLSARLAELEDRINGAVTQAGNAVTTVTQANARTFLSQLKAAVPNFSAIIAHRNWGDYLDETEELTGATLGQLLSHNIAKENLAAATKVYKNFAAKYMEGNGDAAAGYAGGSPSATTVDSTGSGKAEKLKQSDRVKASVDYRKNRITWDELQQVQKKFEEAEKNGNVDYDN